MGSLFGAERSTGRNLNVRQPSSNMKRAVPHRMLDLWENDIAHTSSRSALNMAQITLACARLLKPRFRVSLAP